MRFSMALLTASMAAVSSSASGQQAVQWRVADGGNGHWYAVSTGTATWPMARVQSEEMGATLACTETAAEAAFLRNSGLTSEPFVFVGLYQDLQAPDYAEPAGGWRWVSGEPLDPSLWQPGEPNDYFGDERYGELEGPGRPEYLNDVIPQAVLRYYLEWSADCNDDGIVDYGQCRDGSLPDFDGDNVPDCCETGEACEPGGHPVEWRTTDGGNGHWYQVASSPSIGNSWQAARELAQARGGELAAFGSRSASLHGSLAEWNHVSTTIIFADGSGPVHRTMFLGGRLVDGQWTWVDGSPWPGDAPWFSPGVCDGVPSPNGDGSVLQSFCYGLFWDDRPLLGGGALDKALVEWSEDCNADGTVDYGQILRGQLADADSNGIPDVCETDACPGDVDESGSVDSADLNAVLLTWGTDGGKLDRADCDRNGTVDAMDLALVLNGWGECPTR